jgi:acetylornithine deacetylase/succinyl-diaminopimelate desuccinylase-like protein
VAQEETARTMTDADAARKRRHRRERIAAAFVVAVAAALAAGTIWWARSERRQLQSDTRYIPGPARITPEVLLLRDFVRIDTSHPAGVAAGARWIAGFLRGHGIQAELIESAPGRLNVYARIRGKNRGEGLLLFNHIDVVPPGDGWRLPPFAGGVSGDVMIGRGTLDMKALTICQLLAFVDIARRGDPPEHDLAFLATADEETGSEYGMQWIIAHRPDVLDGLRFGLTEGGVTEMMTQRMTYFGIEVGGKQFVELTVTGPVESLRQARFALEPWIFSRRPERILPAVRQYFRDVAPTRMAYGPYLADIDKTIRDGEFWRLPAPYRDLTQNSLWAGAPETYQERWQMLIRMTNLPDEEPQARIDWLAGQLAPYGVRVDRILDVQKSATLPSPSDNRLFSLLRGEAERRYGVPAGVLVLYRSATDARFLRQIGMHCYGVSPYPVDYFQSLSIHHPNERIRLDGFLAGIDYMKSVVGQWASPAG